MILDRLCELRASLHDDDIPPEGFKKQPVRWVLDLSADGRITGLTQTSGANKKGAQMQTPYARRSGSRPPPFLFVDRPIYVFGIDEDGEPSEKAATRHASYLDLLDKAARQTGYDSVAKLATALRNPEQLAFARAQLTAQNWTTGDLIAPRLDGTYLQDAPSARRFWRELQVDLGEEDGALVAECMLCGETKPIATKHPVETRVGRNPAPLVSMNKAAFRSHGLQQSENAPMCYDCARTYGEALRYLLNDPEHHLYVSGAEWLFWTREPAPAFSPAQLFTDPTAEAVALLRAPFTSHTPSDINANQFFALVVTGAWKRLVVRSWIELPLAEIQENFADYFNRQRIVDQTGESPPQKLMAIAGATVRDLDDLSPQTIPALIDHALTGRRLPINLLYQAVQRAKAEKEYPVTRPRAALIRLVLTSTRPDLMTDDVLIPDHPEPAYHCGRMLAVLDSIQRTAISPKATLVDRYYGSASTSPALVFGTLIRKAQPHLATLRKTKPGLYHYFDNLLQNIALHLTTFPKTLTPLQQGLFALGFYQEKHRASEKKEEDVGSTSETATESGA